MRALSIRQPYAELILRGIKPIEFRSRPTKIIGERFYIYASRQWAEGKLLLEGCRLKVQSDECRVQNEDRRLVTSDNLEVPKAGPQPWMLELAKMLILKDLPTGVIVGTAVIAKCEQAEDRGSRIEDRADASSLSSILNPPSSLFRWHLTDVERVKKLRKPKGHPQPVWFTPF
jgi:predicted transcriptional regulator